MLRKLLIACVTWGLTLPAWALPTGQQVIHGNANFIKQGSTLSITTSDKAIIEYQNFSIGQDEWVKFIQPNANSLVVNRVTGAYSSQLLGALTANGRVMLINPNGIVFGQGARVNVRSLLATTLDIGNQDLLKDGPWTFSSSGLTGASVVNHGEIIAVPGGHVLLLGESVSNTGTIRALGGDVVLASGSRVTVSQEVDASIRVSLDLPAGTTVNDGIISAMGGRASLYGDAVQHTGVIEATSFNDVGGEVEVISQSHTTVGNGSHIDASGGDALQHAGSVIVHSLHGFTDFQEGAVIDVSGGALGGNAGFVELSAYFSLNIKGTMHGGAQAGYERGSLLIDPLNIIIINGGGDAVTGGDNPGGVDEAFGEDAGLTMSFDPQALGSFNGFGDIHLQATNDITVSSAFNLNTATGNTDVNLTLEANNDIIVNGAITADGTGTITLLADADNSGAGLLDINSAVTSDTGAISLTGDDIIIDAAVSANAAISLSASDAITFNQSVSSATSTVTVTADDDNAGDGDIVVGAQLIGTTVTVGTGGTNGDITINTDPNNTGGGITVGTANQLVLNSDVTASGAIDASGYGDDIVLTNNVTITSTGGAIDLSGNHVDGDGAGTRSLTIDSNGTLAIDEIGQNNALSALTVSAGGTTTLADSEGQGANTIDTTGNIDFSGATGGITLSNATLINTTAGNITFENAAIGGAQTLTLTTAAGATISLDDVTTNTLIFGAAFDTLDLYGSVAPTAALTNLTNVTNITLGGNGGFNTSGFNGALDMQPYSVQGTGTLTLNAGNAQIDLDEMGLTTALGGLVVTTSGTVNIHDGNGGDTIRTTGTMNFSGSSGDVILMDNISLVSTGGSINFQNTELEANAADTQTLTLDVAAGGTITLGGVGIDTTLGGLVLDSANYGTLRLSDTMTLTSAVDFSQATAITLVGNTTINTSSFNGALDFSGQAINGGFAFNVNTGNAQIDVDEMGATTAIASFTPTTTGDLHIHDTTGGNGSRTIRATGAIDLTTVGGAITLQDTVFIESTGGNVDVMGVAINSASADTQALTINANGTLDLDEVGQGTRLSALTVLSAGGVNLHDTTGGADTLSANGTIDFSGATGGVTLQDNIEIVSATGDITFQGADINAAAASTETLSLSSTGDITLDGVGKTTLLGGITIGTAGFNTLHLYDNLVFESALDFTNATDIDIAGPVTIDTSGANLALDFTGLPIDGTGSLVLSTGGGAIDLDELGQNTALASLTINTTSAVDLEDTTGQGTGTIRTSGAIDFSGATGGVVLQSNITIQSTGGAITFLGSEIDAANANTQTLTLNAGTTLSLDEMGLNTALGSLTVTAAGITTLNDTVGMANTMQVNGNIDFTGATGGITLADTVVIESLNGNITFENAAINAQAAGTEALTLLVNGTSDITLDAVGTTTRLGGLTLDNAAYDGLTLHDSITVDGGLDLTQATDIMLADDVTLTTSSDNGAIDVTGTPIDGGVNLVINAGGGAIDLDEVGVTTALTSLTVTTTGVTNLRDANAGGSQTIRATGAIDFTAASGGVVLQDNVFVTSTGGAVDFTGAYINAATLNTETLSISGNTTVDVDEIGADTRVGSVTLSSGGVTTLHDTTGRDGANSIEASGNVDMTGAVGGVVLGNTIIIDSSAGNITFQGRDINATTAGVESLTLNSHGAGDITLDGVGQTTRLGGLTIGAGAFDDLILYDHITVDGGLDLTEATDVTLAGNVTLTTSSDNGAIDATGTPIDGSFDLSLQAGAGNIDLDQTGVSTALDALTVTTTGTITIHDANTGNTNTIRATNDVDFSTGGGNVVINDNAIITSTAGDISFLGTDINAQAADTQTLTLDTHAGGTITLDGVGKGTRLGDLVLDTAAFSELEMNDSWVLSSVPDLANPDQITLLANAGIDTSASNDVLDFEGTPVDGAFTFTLNSGASQIDLDEMGGATALVGLTVSTTGALNIHDTTGINASHTIRTSGAQTYTGASGGVTLQDNIMLTSTGGNIDFTGAYINGLGAGAQSVAFSAGGTVDLDEIGLTNNLSSLSVSATGVTTLHDTTGQAGGETLEASGAIDFSGATGGTVLANNIVITSTGGNITFQNSDINATTNDTETLNLEVAAANTITLDGVGKATRLGSLNLNSGNFANLNLYDNLVFGNTPNFTNANQVTLQADVEINTATNNTAIDFTGIPVDGGSVLTLNSGNGTITLDEMGASTRLGGLVVVNTGNTVIVDTLGNSTSTILTTGAQNFSGATGGVQIQDDVQLSSTTGDINFSGAAINAQAAGNEVLTVSSTSGTITLDDVGQGTNVGDLIVSNGGTSVLGGDVTVSNVGAGSGVINFSAATGGTALGANVTLQGNTINFTNSALDGTSANNYDIVLTSTSGDITLAGGTELGGLLANSANDIHIVSGTLSSEGDRANDIGIQLIAANDINIGASLATAGANDDIVLTATNDVLQTAGDISTTNGGGVAITGRDFIKSGGTMTIDQFLTMDMTRDITLNAGTDAATDRINVGTFIDLAAEDDITVNHNLSTTNGAIYIRANNDGDQDMGDAGDFILGTTGSQSGANQVTISAGGNPAGVIWIAAENIDIDNLSKLEAEGIVNAGVETPPNDEFGIVLLATDNIGTDADKILTYVDSETGSFVTSANEDLTILNLAGFSHNAAAGDNLGFTQDATTDGIGEVVIDSNSTFLTGEDFILNSPDPVNITNNITVDEIIQITSFTGDVTITGTATLNSGDDGNAMTPGSIEITSSVGSVTISDGVTLIAEDDDIEISSATDLVIGTGATLQADGDISIQAGTTLTVDGTLTPGAGVFVDLQANDEFSLTSNGVINVSTGDLIIGDNTANNHIDILNPNSDDAITIAGTINVTNGELLADLDTYGISGDVVVTGTLNASDGIFITTNNADDSILGGGTYTVTGNGYVDIRAHNDLNVGAITATQNRGSTNLAVNLVADADSNADGNLVVNGVTANAVDGLNVSIDPVDITINSDVNVSGDLTIAGTGVTTLNANLTADAITITNIGGGIVLGTDVTLDADGGAGNIDLRGSAITGGSRDLTLLAAAGDRVYVDGITTTGTLGINSNGGMVSLDGESSIGSLPMAGITGVLQLGGSLALNQAVDFSLPTQIQIIGANETASISTGGNSFTTGGTPVIGGSSDVSWSIDAGGSAVTLDAVGSNANALGTLTINNASTLTFNADIEAGATVIPDLNALITLATGVDISGDLTISSDGTATLDSHLVAGGAVTLSGNYLLNDNLTLGGTSLALGDASFDGSNANYNVLLTSSAGAIAAGEWDNITNMVIQATGDINVSDAITAEGYATLAATGDIAIGNTPSGNDQILWARRFIDLRADGSIRIDGDLVSREGSIYIRANNDGLLNDADPGDVNIGLSGLVSLSALGIVGDNEAPLANSDAVIWIAGENIIMGNGNDGEQPQFIIGGSANDGTPDTVQKNGDVLNFSLAILASDNITFAHSTDVAVFTPLSSTAHRMGVIGDVVIEADADLSTLGASAFSHAVASGGHLAFTADRFGSDGFGSISFLPSNRAALDVFYTEHIRAQQHKYTWIPRWGQNTQNNIFGRHIHSDQVFGLPPYLIMAKGFRAGD